jgi:hypothetical protein
MLCQAFFQTRRVPGVVMRPIRRVRRKPKLWRFSRIDTQTLTRSQTNNCLDYVKWQHLFYNTGQKEADGVQRMEITQSSVFGHHGPSLGTEDHSIPSRPERSEGRIEGCGLSVESLHLRPHPSIRLRCAFRHGGPLDRTSHLPEYLKRKPESIPSRPERSGGRIEGCDCAKTRHSTLDANRGPRTQLISDISASWPTNAGCPSPRRSAPLSCPATSS